MSFLFHYYKDGQEIYSVARDLTILIWTQDKENHYPISTKFYLLKNIIKVIIVILSIAFFLMSFESVREIGKGLLLSATVAGGILMFAAQGIFSNIISGIQLAFIQSFNIGDTIADPENPEALAVISVDEPTMHMLFRVVVHFHASQYSLL